MSKQKILFFVCILVGVVIFSFVEAINLFWDRNSLYREIEDSLKPRISALEIENNKVNSDLKKVKKTLAETQSNLTTMEEENVVLKEELKSERLDLRSARQTIEEKEAEMAKLNSKNTEVDSENKLLKEKFNAMYIEFLDMKKTLSSIEGLRQAIKDLKSSSKKNRKSASLANKGKTRIRVASTKDTDQEKNTEIQGNRGYLVKDGQSTYVPKVRIEVLPVE
jgi:chromosome segregation ATPase